MKRGEKKDQLRYDSGSVKKRREGEREIRIVVVVVSYSFFSAPLI